MRKIMYIVDYKLNVYNSVTEILRNIITSPLAPKAEIVIVLAKGYDYECLHEEIIEGFRTISTVEKSYYEIMNCNNYTFGEKIRYLLKKEQPRWITYKNSKKKNIKRNSNNKYINQIIKSEHPDLIIFFIYSPIKAYVDICKKHNVKYVHILYDTFISRPGINPENSKEEQYVINNSNGYFVPSFFIEDYQINYQNAASWEKIRKYDLPLLIEKRNVKFTYENNLKNNSYDFTYFGQIQTFRNSDKIKKIFSKLNITLDIFTTMNIESDNIFKVHSAIANNDLWSVVANSKYLVVFDNSKPYNTYLPSKAYLYVSFTKPIIAFGDNDTSALKSFFKEYPMFYYQNINESLDGLLTFINTTFDYRFNEAIYSMYEQYLPQNALTSFWDCVNNILSEDAEKV